MSPRWTENRLRSRVPDGWSVKESFTLLAPDGQANVIVSREPLDPTLITERYAAVQGDLLRREFPGFTEHVLTVLPLASGQAYLRLFSWMPPDGVRVTQHQVYLAASGTGYTATATTPSTNHERYAALFQEVLSSLELGTAPPPAPAPPTPAPPTPAPVPPPAPAPGPLPPPPPTPPSPPPSSSTYVPRPGETVVGRLPDLRIPLPPAPPPQPSPPPDQQLWAAVDRVLVAAVDVVDGRRPGPTDAAGPDEPAVDAALQAVLGGSELPWQGRSDVEPRVRARLRAWADGARRVFVATDPGDPESTAAQLWAAAGLIGSVAAAARRGEEVPQAGLARVLARVREGLPEPDGAWDEDVATVVVVRPTRYRLRTALTQGSGRLLAAGNAATLARWGQEVDHTDLPIPVALAENIDRLLAQYDAGLEWQEGDPPSFISKRDAFGNGYEYLLKRLRAALGPAYQVLDTARY